MPERHGGQTTLVLSKTTSIRHTRWRHAVLGLILFLVGCAGTAASPDSCPVRLACRIQVASGAEFAAALAQVGCGCEIVLADGIYQGDFGLQKPCPANLPTVVRAENPLAAIIRSPLRLAGEHAVVLGLGFEGPDARIVLGGNSNRVLRNRFTGWKDVAVRAVVGSDAEIAYNEFSEPAPWSLGGLLRFGISSIEPSGGLHRGAWVHHNHFHDFPPKPDPKVYASGQSDAIEICDGTQPVSDVRSGWTIERNLIERHQGGYGIIDVLCGGTTVRGNTILASPGGRIDLRQGSYSVLAGNWLEDAGGSVIHGGHHRVLGNHLSRPTTGGYPDLAANLVLTAGNVPWDYTGPKRLPDKTSVHQAAYKVLIAGNSAAGLHVGWQRSPAYMYPVRESSIEQHAGPVLYGFEQATAVRWRASVPVPAAVRLDATNVGPLAASSCPLMPPRVPAGRLPS